MNSISENKVLLREITEDDLAKIAEIHLSAFPNSALTRLGPKIVERYYLWQLIGQHQKVRATIAVVDENCAGFSFSGDFTNPISGFIDHNKFFLGREILIRPWLLLNPFLRERIKFAIKLLKNLTKKKQNVKKYFANEINSSFGILAIGVLADYQGFGIGKLLMLDAESEAVNCEYKRMHLTVNTENVKAIKFYEKLGWQKSVTDKVWKGSMTKQL